MERLTISEYASKYGFTEAAVMYKLNQGIIDGFEEDGVWYVGRASQIENQSERLPSDTALLESDHELEETNTKRPASTNQVEYVGRGYIITIVAVLVILLLFNLINLFFGHIVSIVPIIFQVSVLFLLYQRHRWAISAVRVWAILLIVGGGSRLLSILLKSASYNIFDTQDAFADVTIGIVALMLFQLGFGIPCLILLRRSIKPVEI